MSARMMKQLPPMSPELKALLERARNHVMTPAERVAQRRSWVKGEFMMEHPEMSEADVDALLDKTLPELTRKPHPMTASDTGETRAFWETPRAIPHDEACEATARLVNSHFKNDAERARVSIPANPGRDEDLLVMSYVRQQRRNEADLRAQIASLTERAVVAERGLIEAHDHITHADAYQQTAMSNLDRALAAEARIATLTEALDYASEALNTYRGAAVEQVIERIDAALSPPSPTNADAVITPAMRKAGIEAYHRWDKSNDPYIGKLVESVFLIMKSADAARNAQESE